MGSQPGLGPGRRLNGIYEIERLIAVGGMGEVYKGRAIQTGDAVAIKTIRPELAQNEAALGLFRKEAAALHNLYHEAIVRYYVFSVDPDVGAPYLAMEYVDGQPLSEVVKKGALGYEAMRVLQRRLAAGLQAAHELGIVHRDVSPDNVILPAGNVARAKIIDFGIARSTMLGDATIIGHGVAGKFAYMSPEQLGLFGGDVTAKSDIYSLGLVLAEALTGRPLDMGGSQVQVVEKRRKVPDLSGVDARLRPLLEKMLQPKPADRIASMAEVASWQPAASAPAGTRRTPLLIGGIAALAVATVGAALTVRPLYERLWAPQDPGSGAERPVDAEVIAAEERTLAAEFERLRQADQRRGEPAQPVQRPAGSPASTEELVTRLAKLASTYDAGPCALLIAARVPGSGLQIEGYAPSRDAFSGFVQAFRAAGGGEPLLTFRQINQTQCPAMSFLKSVARAGDTALRLAMGANTLAANEPLRGTLEGFGARHVDMMLVGDDGYVYNLAEFTRRAGDKMEFAIRVAVKNQRGLNPLIVIAVASDPRLSILQTTKPIPGDDLFPLLLNEVRAQNLSLDLAVGYSRIER